MNFTQSMAHFRVCKIVPGYNVECPKELKRIERYAKIANTITIEDFFKTSTTLPAKVMAFCFIRGYTEDQTRKILEVAAENMRRSQWRDHGCTKEGAASMVRLHIEWMFHPKEAAKKMHKRFPQHTR